MESLQKQPAVPQMSEDTVALQSRFNSEKGIEQLSSIFADIGGVLEYCHLARSCKPDLANYPQAEEDWKKMDACIISIINQSQSQYKELIGAFMKLKLIIESVNTMNKGIFTSQAPMDALELYQEDCKANMDIASDAAQVFELAHKSDVQLINSSFEALATKIGAQGAASLQQRFLEIDHEIENINQQILSKLSDENFDKLNSELAETLGKMKETSMLKESTIKQKETTMENIKHLKNRQEQFEKALKSNEEKRESDNKRLFENMQRELHQKTQEYNNLEQIYQKQKEEQTRSIFEQKQALINRIQNPGKKNAEIVKTEGWFWWKKTIKEYTLVNEDIQDFKRSVEVLNQCELMSAETMQKGIESHNKMLQENINQLKQTHKELQQFALEGNEMFMQGLQKKIEDTKTEITNQNDQYVNQSQEVDKYEGDLQKFQQNLEHINKKIQDYQLVLLREREELSKKAEKLISESDELRKKQDALLKQMGQNSLNSLLEQLQSIEALQKSIGLRTFMLGKALSFANSFSLTIKTTMNKINEGITNFKAIKNADTLAEINDKVCSSEDFKQFINQKYQNAKNFEDIKNAFEDCAYDSSVLNDLATISFADQLWDDYGIKMNPMQKKTLQSYCKQLILDEKQRQTQLKQADYKNIFLPILEGDFKQTTDLVSKLVNIEGQKQTKIAIQEGSHPNKTIEASQKILGVVAEQEDQIQQISEPTRSTTEQQVPPNSGDPVQDNNLDNDELD